MVLESRLWRAVSLLVVVLFVWVLKLVVIIVHEGWL